MRKILGLLLIISASFILWKCASQTTPTGGPKDEKPPVLKKSVPLNKETNFKGRVVELTFDELIKLNNAKEEIIITPSLGKDVTFTAKQNKVLIEPKSGWKDSTTYGISFREGIQDLNEGNPATNLHLAFSTGATIDSLQIKGKITESRTEKIPEKITVALYQEDTFDIFKHSPQFFTKTLKNGSFKIENLKQGTYHIYAFDDKNKNLKIESTTERFGFQPNAIEVIKNQDSVNIAIYQLDSRPLKINSIRNSGSISYVRLNKNLISYSIKNPNKEQLFHSFGDTQSEISIYNDLPVNDSIKISLHGTDSLALTIDSTFFIKRVESKLSKEKFLSKNLYAKFSSETLTAEIKTQFNKPILKFNFDSAYLTPDAVPEPKPKEKIDKKKDDSKKEANDKPKELAKKDTATIKPILKIPIASKNVSIDSAKKTVTISIPVDKKLITDKVKQLNVVFEDTFVISVESDSSKREIKTLSIPNDETTGILHIEINTKFKNYEVLLMSSAGVIIQKARNVKKYSFKYLQPQDYKIMMYADLNNNGVWDAHNIYENKIQEPTFFYKTTEGKYTFPVRSAWELGPLILKF